MLGIEPRRAFFIEVELLSRQVGEQRSRGAFKGRTGYVSGTSVDRFLLWMYPLHSGQAFGLLGRILVCITEVVVAVLAGLEWPYGFESSVRSSSASPAVNESALIQP